MVAAADCTLNQVGPVYKIELVSILSCTILSVCVSPVLLAFVSCYFSAPVLSSFDGRLWL